MTGETTDRMADYNCPNCDRSGLMHTTEGTGNYTCSVCGLHVFEVPVV